ncbi:MAG: hypothetical protein GF364_22435, partial [Candidatus Lokiarchaeota archaeon]|nr:hypothetical protein [Candidatus Lokiarchaeota archaeon]
MKKFNKILMFMIALGLVMFVIPNFMDKDEGLTNPREFNMDDPSAAVATITDSNIASLCSGGPGNSWSDAWIYTANPGTPLLEGQSALWVNGLQNNYLIITTTVDAGTNYDNNDGIMITGSKNVRVQGSTIYNAQHGVYIQGSGNSYIEVIDSEIYGCHQSGIRCDNKPYAQGPSYCIFSGNDIYNIPYVGIWLDGDNCNVHHNTIWNIDDGSGSGIGIWVRDDPSNTIAEQGDPDNNAIYSNEITTCVCGMMLGGANTGLSDGSNNDFTYNTITDCDRGMWIQNYGADNHASLIQDNVISDCTEYGMYLDNADDMTFNNNTFVECADYAMYLTSSSSSNVIQDNNFVKNNMPGTQAYNGGSSNNWNGNYWDECHSASSYDLDGAGTNGADNSPLSVPSDNNLGIHFLGRPMITKPEVSEITWSTYTISWNGGYDSEGQTVDYTLYYRIGTGSWISISGASGITQLNFNWDTTGRNDGNTYELRCVAHVALDNLYSEDTSDGDFIIQNDFNTDASITNPGAGTYSDTITIQWNEAQLLYGGSVEYDLEYKYGAGSYQYISGAQDLTGSSFVWDVKGIVPFGSGYQIRLTYRAVYAGTEAIEKTTVSSTFSLEKWQKFVVTVRDYDLDLVVGAEVYMNDGSTPFSGTTDGNGQVTFYGGYDSTWNVLVTYNIDSVDWTVHDADIPTSTDDYTYQVNVPITCDLTNLILNVNDRSGNDLSGVDVSFDRLSDDRDLTTDGSGNVQLTELLYDSLWEVIVSDNIDGTDYVGYRNLNYHVISSEFKYSDSINLDRTNLELHFVDNRGDPLVGATVFIETESGAYESHSDTTDGNGNVTFTEVPNDRLWHIKVTFNDGYNDYIIYDNDPGPYWSGVTDDFVVFKEFSPNQDKYLELQINDLSGNPVPQDYEVYLENLGTEYAYPLDLTDSNGNCSYSDITNDWYWVQVNTTILGVEYIVLNTTFQVNTYDFVIYQELACSKTNLVLHINDLDNSPAAGVGSGSSVYIENKNFADENYTLTTDADGNVTFSLLGKTSDWYIIVNRPKAGYGMLLVLDDEFSISATGGQHAYYINDYCEYTNVEYTVTDTQGDEVIGATINFWKGTDVRSEVTDVNGQVLFTEVDLGTWNYNVTFELLDAEFLLAEDTTVVDTSYPLVRSLNIENAQMAKLSLTVVDDSVTDPEYWALVSAKVTLWNASTEMAPLNTYTTDENGQIFLSLPTQTFNFSIEYKSATWEHRFLKGTTVLTPTPRKNQTLDMTNPNHIGAIYMNVSVELSKTVLTINGLQFDGGSGWDQVGAQFNGTNTEPYEFTLFSDDNATITFLYWNISADPWERIDYNALSWDEYAFGNWNISNSKGVVIQSASGESAIDDMFIGNGQYQLKINTSGWLAGVYVFDFILKTEQYYEDDLVSVEFTVKNHTASLTRTLPSGQVKGQWSTDIDIQVNYTSIYPESSNLTAATFYYDIIGATTGHSVTYSGQYGLYEFSIDTSLLEIGTYDVKVYGNQTFVEYEELTFQIEVEPLASDLSFEIIANQRAGFTNLKTSIGENITFTITWTEDGGTPFSNYGLATVTVLIGTVDFSSFLYWNGDETYTFTVESTQAGIGMHNVYIDASYPHYVDQSDSLTATVLDSWNTEFTVAEPLTYHLWGNNVSFVTEFSCTEHPRSGNMLAGATINDLNITYTDGGTDYVEVYFDATAMALNKWGYIDQGNGQYLIWFKTEYMTVIEEKLFYAKPTISLANYDDAELETYFYVRGLETNMNGTTASEPGELLELIEIGKDETETINIMFFVDDSASELDGDPLTNAESMTFVIRNNTETNKSIYTPGQGSLINIGGGYYSFELNDSVFTVGKFKITVTGTLGNHTDGVFEFLLIVNYEQIDFDINIPDYYAVSGSSMRVASGQNITFSFNITTATVDSPTLIVYTYNGTGEQIDLTSYLYSIGVTAWNCTFETTDLDHFNFGIHTIVINISQDLYTDNEKTIECDLIEYWDTQLELIDPLDTYSWNEIGWFIINYTSNENPRYDWVLPGATISQLTIMNKNNPSEFFILLPGDRGNTWNWTDLSTGDAPGYPGSGLNGSGAYLIWFNTSVVNVSDPTTYYIIPEISITHYETTQLNIPTVISPLDTILTKWAIYNDGVEDIEQNPLSFLYLEKGWSADIYIEWNVSDPDNTLYGMPFDGENIPYAIYYKSDDSLNESGFLSPVGGFPGRYTMSLDTNLEDEFYVIITCVKENYTEQIFQFGYNIGNKYCNFSVNIPSNLEYQANRTIKVAQSDNVSFVVWFDGIDDPFLTDVTLTITIDGISVEWYAIPGNPYAYNVTSPASNWEPGLYEVQIIADKVKYRPWGMGPGSEKTYDLEVIIIDAWDTGITILEYPTIYPWSNTASITFEYKVTEDPRTGWLLNNSQIVNLTVYNDELGLNYFYDMADYGVNWGYSNLGDGIYELWFDTSDVTVSENTYFFMQPCITQTGYKTNYPLPHLWIAPVQTSLATYTNATDGLTNIVDLGNLITKELNEGLWIYTNYSVTDELSIFSGDYVSSATLTYIIYDADTMAPIWTGDLTTDNSDIENYQAFFLEGIRIGYYYVEIKAERTNFGIQFNSFYFNVTKISIDWQYGDNVDAGVVTSPRNWDLGFTIHSDVVGGILNITIDGTLYQFYDSGDGTYVVNLPSSVFKEYEQNVNIELAGVLYKTNHTAAIIDITLRLGMDADPYLGIPYLYWMIVTAIVVSFIAAIVIRKTIIYA